MKQLSSNSQGSTAEPRRTDLKQLTGNNSNVIGDKFFYA